MSGPKWWEKTVEYRFLEILLNNDKLVPKENKSDSSIVPLDGTHEEEAGDAILKLSDKWVLIEFKRDKTCLSSEIQKYGDLNNYKSAKDKLQNDGDHHFLIYGDSSESSTVLNLKSQLYWGDKTLDLARTLVETLVEALKAPAQSLIKTLIQDLLQPQAQTLTETLTQAQAQTLTPDLALVLAQAQAQAQVQTLTWILTWILNPAQQSLRLTQASIDALTKAQALTATLTETLAKNNNSDSSKNFPITNIFENGKEYNGFVKYLNDLKMVRKEDGTGGGSAVAMSIKDGNLITIPIVKNELDLSLEDNISNVVKNNNSPPRPK